MKKWFCLLFLLLSSLTLANSSTFLPASRKSPDQLRELKPSDALSRTLLILKELELIRFEMGRPKNQKKDFLVKEASPREVFFQAFALFERTNLLRFENARTKDQNPLIPKEEILPGHVWEVLNRALSNILIVKNKLGIKKQLNEDLQADSTKPSQVFTALIHANRIVNLLLERQIQPSDVFQKISLAVNYTERLLAQFPRVNRIPQADAYESGKTPLDVCHKILEAFSLLSEIAEISGLNILKIESDTESTAEVSPSDVFNMASLIVAQVSYFHGKLLQTKDPVPVYYPGKKFPSHVYQRMSILIKQLKELKNQALGNPNWLNMTKKGN